MVPVQNGTWSSDAAICLFVCLFMLATPRYACGGTATLGATFPGHPDYTRAAAEETHLTRLVSTLWLRWHVRL